MGRRLAFVVAAGLGLSGCCLGGGCYIQPQNIALANWDGFGPLPKPNKVKRAKVRETAEATASEDNSPNEQDLARLTPYTREWGAAFDAMNRAADEKLRKKLIICRDCMPPQPEDQTSSVTPKHMAGGYLPVRQ
jgi:hypothetical protein